jgi:hypothetical protein
VISREREKKRSEKVRGKDTDIKRERKKEE